MKHILSINELYKSTYISAANKMGGRHGSRKSDLIKHADLKGINEPIDREFHHRFIFDKIDFPSDFYYGVHPKGFSKEELKKMGPFAPNPPYFFISNFKYETDGLYNSSSYSEKKWQLVLRIDFKSNYGDVINILCYFNLNKEVAIHVSKPNNPSESSRRIYFSNRKDAVMFKKFLVNEVIPELETQKIIANSSEYLLNNFSEATYLDKGRDRPVIKKVSGNPQKCYIPLSIIKDISINDMYKSN